MDSNHIIAVFIALSLAQAAQAPPEVTLVLRDLDFRLDRPIEGGPMRWRVRNEGTDIIRA